MYIGEIKNQELCILEMEFQELDQFLERIMVPPVIEMVVENGVIFHA